MTSNEAKNEAEVMVLSNLAATCKELAQNSVVPERLRGQAREFVAEFQSLVQLRSKGTHTQDFHGKTLLIKFAGVLPGFSQTKSELQSFLSQRLGLNQDRIAAIQHGQPFAKNAEPRSPAEIFVVGVIYINAAPESYVKFVSDPSNLRHLPFPQFLAVKNFSNPPQISDL